MYHYGLGCRTTNCRIGANTLEPGDPWYAGPTPDVLGPDDPWYAGPGTPPISPPADSGAGGTETESPAAVESTPTPVTMMGGNSTFGLLGALLGFAVGRGRKKWASALVGGGLGYFLGDKFAH